MKNLFVLFSMILLFAFCGKNINDNNFYIDGEFTNIKTGKKVALFQLTASTIIPIDSAFCDENGKFKLRGFTKIPRLFALQVSKNEYIHLVIDSADNIKIKADFKNFFDTYKLEGSKDCILAQQIDKQLRSTLLGLDSIGAVYRLYLNSSKLDSIKNKCDNARNELILKQKVFSRNFVEKNNESFVSLLAISQFIANELPVFQFDTDQAYFEKVYESLYKLYPQSEDLKALKNYMLKRNNSQSKVKIGDIAPEINLKNPEGKEITLSSLQGKYVLLDFWASWCRPCRDENPNLVTIYNKYKQRGFEIYQVSLDKSLEAWKAAIKQDNLTWTHVSDLKYWQASPAVTYDVKAIPMNFLIDKEGKILYKNLRGEQLSQKLYEIFGK